MFTPASNEGFNPNLLGGGLPSTSFEAPLSHEEQIRLYDNFADVVIAGLISSDQAKYHLEQARQNVQYAHQLQTRFMRPGGFFGNSSVIGGTYAS